MAPEPRIGFEMTLLRMLAFRPETAAVQGSTEGRTVAAAAIAAPARAAAPAPAAGGVRLTSINAGNWTAVVEAANLSGMVRQFALNCVPGSFDNDVLVLKIDEATADRRTRPIEEKLVQGLSKHLGRDVRVTFETAASDLATPARQLREAEQDKLVRAASAFEADPTVKGLRERFGADVDAASVKPTN
jgi:DNA polymerase-3 subunit gamma/tau